MIVYVPCILIDDFWPTARPFLELAVAENPIVRLEDAHHALRRGAAALFMVNEEDRYQAAVVMEIREYFQRLVANIWLMGGEPGIFERVHAELEEVLIAWSKEQGCSTIMLLGRPGWTRLLGRRENAKPFVLMWREIDAGHFRPSTVGELAN